MNLTLCGCTNQLKNNFREIHNYAFLEISQSSILLKVTCVSPYAYFLTSPHYFKHYPSQCENFIHGDAIPHQNFAYQIMGGPFGRPDMSPFRICQFDWQANSEGEALSAGIQGRTTASNTAANCSRYLPDNDILGGMSPRFLLCNTSMGRKRIEIQPIDDSKARSVSSHFNPCLIFHPINVQSTFAKRKRGVFKKAYELGQLTKCQVKLAIITNRGVLYEYKSSEFDTKLKVIKRVAESHDETSMAKVGVYSIFFF